METIIVVDELNPITDLPFTDEEKLALYEFKRKKVEIMNRMAELRIDIEIKSFKSPSLDHFIYGFYSILFDGKQSCVKVIDGHNFYYDKSEILDIVCEYFKHISLWREDQNLKT